MTGRRMLRAALAVPLLPISVAVGLVAGVPSGPAAASTPPGIAVAHTEVADDGTVSVVLDVALPAGKAPDLGSAEVTVDGAPVDATARAVEAGEVSRTTVLTLDASESMGGAKLTAAKAAAKVFLAAAPSDVKIGLLTFSDRAHDVIAPTTDRSRLAAAVDGIRLTRGTHLYDAVAQAADLAGSDGARDVLLLSDGRDTGSTRTLADAASTAKDQGIAVDVVALDQSTADRALISRISSASGGQVITATDPAALRSAFQAEADALASQVLVQFQRPTKGPEDVTLDVSLAAGGTTYDDSAFVSLPHTGPGGPQVVHAGKPLLGPGALLVGAGALGLGLATLIAMLLLGSRGPSESQRRVAAYLGESSPRAGPTNLKGSAVAFTEKVVKGDFETKLSQRLNAAGISLTAAEWILLCAGIAVAAAFVGLVLGGGVLMVLGVIAGGLLPPIVLKLKHSRRLSAFAGQLPETLTLMSGGLSAGLSLAQTVDTVVQEGHEPMAGELRRALVEHRLGVTVEDGLDGVAARMESEDFRWVVMAVRIQREVGGNLSEILNTVAETLRERDYLRRQVKSLSAEGRLSAWMLGCLPVGLFFYMSLANPSYVRVLYTTLVGYLLLGGAVALLATGAFFMSRLVKVEV